MTTPEPWTLVCTLDDECADGHGMCVANAHNAVVTSCRIDLTLHVYSMDTGDLIRRLGTAGSGRGQFNFVDGGLCEASADTVMVAESENRRVQEVRVTDGSFVAFYGAGQLVRPQFVDCNDDVVVVSEDRDAVAVLSRIDGTHRAHVTFRGRPGDGPLREPRGLHLLDGHGGVDPALPGVHGHGDFVVVADAWHHRVCLTALHGGYTKTIVGEATGLQTPVDVVSCGHGGLLIADTGLGDVVRTSAGGAVVQSLRASVVYGGELVAAPGSGPRYASPHSRRPGRSAYRQLVPCAVAVTALGDIVVREFRRLLVFHEPSLRLTWMAVVCVAARAC